MPSRRDFLGAIGMVSGMLATMPEAWAQGRKEVWIAGKRIKTVDIHAHASIKEVEEVIRGTNVERNIVMEGALDFPGDLGNIVGNPLETAFLFTRMIFDGTFDRFPNLKICGAHGGGFLPSYFGRTDVACNGGGAEDCRNQKPPREYLRTQIFADSMVFSDEGLRHLVAEMGASQVVYGTDMPLGWPDTMDLIIESPHLSNAEKEAILGGNLIRLLRIDRTI